MIKLKRGQKASWINDTLDEGQLGIEYNGESYPRLIVGIRGGRI